MKIKIFMTLAGFIFSAMLLMSLVMAFLSHRFLAQSEIEHAKAIVLSMTMQYGNEFSESDSPLASGEEKKIIQMAGSGRCRGLLIFTKELKQRFLWGNDPMMTARLKETAFRVIHKNGLEDSFYAENWFAPWSLPEIYVVGFPIIHDHVVIGGISGAFSLSRIKANMKKLLRLSFLYLLFNTVLFSVAGFFRFDRLILKPLQKLVKRASEYRFGDGEVLPYNSGGGEWETLYRAVNRIVALNAADNRALKETVASLQRAMAELKIAQQEIIRTEKLATVGRLSSGIAHEIGNPIGIVIGYLELLKAVALSNEEKEDIIGRTETEIRRIDHIIRQLLDFSRPNQTHIISVSAHAVLHEVVEMMRFQPNFSQIAVHLDLVAKADRVAVDPDQFHQALLNLILNAADAIESVLSDRDGRLSISSENTIASINEQQRRSFLKISIADNGEGISKESLGNIFDPFYSTKAPGKGTGLGLWVSMMIIEGFGGKIFVDSLIHKGTTMSVLLPVDSESPIFEVQPQAQR